ncbi:phage tail tape measure protein [Bacillus sp. AS_5]|uniref:phage tail tape measure protein n=1 Tax=Bacillus TaxID=1386 RepID=UPI000BEDBB08|nr:MULTISPECIES: phage tail tape measure protein [Bacillus]MCW4656966.1 phage tail tape measure protein [Bacillus sp. AS_3]MCX2704705.1 phage tail tape measure protein [Bacillus sp. AS_5]MDA2236559.1 phage tail tape measure protein [Bacillus cereus]PEF92037.1 phage tail tape measure protein [Bacillus cereus]
MAANAGEVRARLVLDNAQFRQGVSQARQDMQGLNQNAQSSSQGMAALSKASAAAGVAVVAAVGSSVKAAANFEQSMAKVKAISGATDEEFKQLNATAKHLGATTQFSASQAADGLSFLSLAGFSAKDSIDAMPAVLNLAAAGAIGLGEAADISSNIMTGFGIAATDTGKAADVLTKTFTTANTDMNQLGMAMKYVAPVAKSLGWDITDAATAVAKMSDAGIQGSQAGTSLRAALLSLANPTGQTEKAFKKLGISVVDANGQFKPLPELIGHISSKMEGMTDAQKTVTAAQLVGTEASAGFLALIDQGQGSLQAYKTALEQSGGTAERIAKIQQDTLVGAWTQVKSAAEGLAIGIGEALLPAFTSLAQGATVLIGALAEIDPRFVAAGLAAAGTAAGLMIFVTNIGKVVSALNVLRIAMVANPYTLAIGAVAAAVGGLTYMLSGAKNETEEYKAVNMDTYQSLGEQARSLEQTATEYDKMRGKVKLSSEELLRYRDLQEEIKRVEDPATKQALQKELDGYTKKAKANNDEINKTIGLSDELIAKAPTTAQVYSTTGQAIAENTQAAKELVAALKEKQQIELAQQIAQGYKNQVKDLQDYKKAVDEGNEAISRRKQLQNNVDEMQVRVNEREKEYNKYKDEGNKLMAHFAKNKLENAQKSLEAAKQEQATNEQTLQQSRATLQDLQEKQRGLENAVQIRIKEALAAANVAAESGKEIEALDKAIAGHEKKLASLEKAKNSQDGLNDKQKEEYEHHLKSKEAAEKAKQVISETRENHAKNTEEIQKQKEEYGKLNEEAGKPVDKEVNLKKEKAEADNKKLEEDIKKKADKEAGLDPKKAEEDNAKLKKKVEEKADKKVGVDKNEADKGVADLDKKAVAEKVKKIFGNTTAASLLIDMLDLKATAEKTKKVKADKSQADSAIADTDRKALAEKVKKILGDGKLADAVIKVLDQHAEKKATKPIDADTSNADKKHESLMSKITRAATKTISLSWLGDLSPLKYFHSGGTVGASPSNRSTRPKFHNGGNPRGLVGRSPRFDEVDARLLKNEMVLTQAQQANLFNFIRTANRPNTVAAFGQGKPQQGGGDRRVTNNFQIAELHVREEADVERIAAELKRMERAKERSRGR